MGASHCRVNRYLGEDCTRETSDEQRNGHYSDGGIVWEDGDQWCLCAGRWEQARQAGHAPKVRLQATNMVTLAVCSLDDLKAHAIDLM